MLIVVISNFVKFEHVHRVKSMSDRQRASNGALSQVLKIRKTNGWEETDEVRSNGEPETTIVREFRRNTIRTNKTELIHLRAYEKPCNIRWLSIEIFPYMKTTAFTLYIRTQVPFWWKPNWNRVHATYKKKTKQISFLREQKHIHNWQFHSQIIRL